MSPGSHRRSIVYVSASSPEDGRIADRLRTLASVGVVDELTVVERSDGDASLDPRSLPDGFRASLARWARVHDVEVPGLSPGPDGGRGDALPRRVLAEFWDDTLCLVAPYEDDELTRDVDDCVSMMERSVRRRPSQ